MIENHLYSLVTDVKYKLLPCLLAILLTGCDRTEVTLSFTPEMASFTLSIVPNDQVDQPDSQVVGHCANDTHKILYTRTTSGNVSAPAQSTQDGAPAEPQ